MRQAGAGEAGAGARGGHAGNPRAGPQHERKKPISMS